MDAFYTHYYQAVATSLTNAYYCERLYGINLCQHGFAEVGHIDHLLLEAGVTAGTRVLDLGCGNGFIAEYINLRTRAHVTGIDNAAAAIRQAQVRTAGKDLTFQVMDMAHLDFPAASFDVVVAIDTLYFAPLDQLLAPIFHLLKPGGRLAAFWSQGAMPEEDLDAYPRRLASAEGNDLGAALTSLGRSFRYLDYTQADLDHARRKQRLADVLRPEFEAEGNLFLYENHVGEARGAQRAIAAGAHGRYLYVVTA